MENESGDVESGEQISESFICCVCLELLYKPVVLACGHVSCFWCVHRTMDGVYESHCPICRNAYAHFPAICQMLHFLLLKIYPVAYKTRETHILEEEKKMDCFSPKVDDILCGLHTNEGLNHLDDRAQSFTFCDGENLSSNLSSNRKEECAKVEQQELVACIQDNCTTMPKQIIAEGFKSTCTVGVKENHSPQISGQISIVDVLCASCKQLLFRPAVLNCGHVYCEACIVLGGETIRCQICQSPHPGGFPKVCLEFDHFLEEQFPEEYSMRRGTVQPKQVQFHHDSSTCLTKEDGVFRSLGERVHFGVGCDSCGMCPIKGDRYRCIHCKEAIGFDLCSDCYNTPSKLPGRFNQQHTPDHKFEKKEANRVPNVVLQMLRGGLVTEILPPSVSGDALGNPENELPLVAPLTDSDVEEPENDDTQSTK